MTVVGLAHAQFLIIRLTAENSWCPETKKAAHG
jgi:hypothetical protein